LLRRLLVLPLIASLAILTTTLTAGAQQPATPAPEPGWEWVPTVRAAAAAEAADAPEQMQGRIYRAAIHDWFEGIARLEAIAIWNAELDRQAEAARARQSARVPRSSGSSSSPARSAGGGIPDPCAEPMNGLLPNNIVQRESSGRCDAYNDGGCQGRDCLGWAQIDLGHFSADSPWGPGPGSCYGLTYNGCVAKLSNGGSNLDPWKCC
jgi:hypothetical protein